MCVCACVLLAGSGVETREVPPGGLRREVVRELEDHARRVRVPGQVEGVQGYLTYKKAQPPRTLP